MDLRVEREAPCVAACPVHTDTRLYVEHILHGRYEGALDLLLAANPFSSVCGRICHHPCEQSCRRSKVDAPVGLRQLKRFVVEATRDYRERRRAPVRRSRKESIAVVGAGPAGLTAAHDLARAGLGVTVFEAGPEPGGMLGTTIPRYRLPYHVLREDIDDVLALGVELQTSCKVGEDIGLGELRRRHWATLIATGLSESRTLGVPGIDSRGVLLALPLLRAISAGDAPPVGGRVVVIGGGNVAADVARCVRRLGATEVTMASLESREELPAWEWEIEEALEEGIELAPGWGPKAVLARDGAVSGIELKRCVRVFDEGGGFNPAFDEDETRALAADTVVLAIGQAADLTCLTGSEVKVVGGGRLEYDVETMATSERGVFACGEVSTGPGAAVEAVADGHRAARAIQHFLDTGELLKQAPREELRRPVEQAPPAPAASPAQAGSPDSARRAQPSAWPVGPALRESALPTSLPAACAPPPLVRPSGQPTPLSAPAATSDPQPGPRCSPSPRSTTDRRSPRWRFVAPSAACRSASASASAPNRR